MKKYYLFALAAFFIAPLLSAQNVVISSSVIASAGTTSSSNDIVLSWTLGDLAVTTLQGGDYILSQGFQQGLPKGVGFDLNTIEWKINAYPNPVSRELNIQFDVPEVYDFTLEIHDVSGKILYQDQQKRVQDKDLLQIDMSDYTSGIYFLRISTNNREQMRIMTISKI